MCLGVPGQIIDVVESPLRLGRVAFGSTIKEISLACVPDAGPGAWVVVHAGLALDQLDEAEAKYMLECLNALAEGQEQEGA